jgi:hypothetical protein
MDEAMPVSPKSSYNLCKQVVTQDEKNEIRLKYTNKWKEDNTAMNNGMVEGIQKALKRFIDKPDYETQEKLQTYIRAYRDVVNAETEGPYWVEVNALEEERENAWRHAKEQQKNG